MNLQELIEQFRNADASAYKANAEYLDNPSDENMQKANSAIDNVGGKAYALAYELMQMVDSGALRLDESDDQNT